MVKATVMNYSFRSNSMGSIYFIAGTTFILVSHHIVSRLLGLWKSHACDAMLVCLGSLKGLPTSICPSLQ